MSSLPTQRRVLRCVAVRARGSYLLPSMFTAGNLAAGILCDRTGHSGTAAIPGTSIMAAKAIGIAIVFDFFDGGIARLTNTASDFGRELDSLADVITFGVAPAVLAWIWGFRMLPMEGNPEWRTQVIASAR